MSELRQLWKAEFDLPVIAVVEGATDDEAMENAKALIGRGSISLGSATGVIAASIGITPEVSVTAIEMQPEMAGE